MNSLPPPDAWSHGLQELGIAARVAISSLATLRSTTALEKLHLFCAVGSPSDSSTWDGLLETAGANTQLQRLDIVYDYDAEEELVMGIDLAGSLLRLHRRCPHLAINPQEDRNLG